MLNKRKLTRLMRHYTAHSMERMTGRSPRGKHCMSCSQATTIVDQTRDGKREKLKGLIKQVAPLTLVSVLDTYATINFNSTNS